MAGIAKLHPLYFQGNIAKYLLKNTNSSKSLALSESHITATGLNRISAECWIAKLPKKMKIRPKPTGIFYAK